MGAAADISGDFALGAAVDLLKTRLRDPANAWAIGALGALAEFARDADENAELTETERGGSAVTARGAIIAAAPDVIITTSEGLEALGGVDGLLAIPGFSQTPAGRDGLILAYPEGDFLTFGPRVAESLERLITDLDAQLAGS